MINDFFKIPELAICAYEEWSGLHVVVHDLDHTLLFPYLAADHVRHAQPWCAAVKSAGLLHKCHAFESDHLHRIIVDYPEGRVHLCHAGLVEWVAPIWLENRLALILFAGQRMPGQTLTNIAHDPGPPTRVLPWDKAMQLPSPVEEAESALLLEGLRQLAARLQNWLVEAQKFVGHPLQRPSQSDLASRRNFVFNFIYRHHYKNVTLADLAQELHLSESRAAHVVKEACGASFGVLVTAARIRSAATLLRHSNLAVAKIGVQCGFGDISHFHRVFKQQTGVTPAAYRRQAVEV
ncbi:MAG: helix-turn-helix domain-containing protein [Caldilineaceae bacterium]